MACARAPSHADEGRSQWGRLAQFDVLDTRQYRDAPPCGWGEAAACPAAYDPKVTVLMTRRGISEVKLLTADQ